MPHNSNDCPNTAVKFRKKKYTKKTNGHLFFSNTIEIKILYKSDWRTGT